jgi:adenosylcobinamide kinase/adenosylcobinamide-phosphate guanylyltransferase
MLTLILGGARSGKSRFAQTLCQNAKKKIYLATARLDLSDAEMSARIGRHRRERPPDYLTIEEPLEIARVVSQHAAVVDCAVLLDCVTVWLSNLMWEHREETFERREEIFLFEAAAFAETAVVASCNVVAVSNEVGSAVVPENALAREFRDLQGFVNQTLAARAKKVFLIVAGLPLELKNVE